MPEIAQATITVTPVMQGAQQTITNDLTGAAQPAGAAAGKVAGASMSEAIGKKMNSAGTAMTKGLTAPIMAVGTASVAAWRSVDEGLDTIVQKTGASGEALDDMSQILRNLTTTIPTDFATAGTAIGEVNTRFGVTGQALEDLSAQFIKFAELNGTDVNSSIDSVQAAMAAFGLEAEDAADVLDILNKAGQNTGVPMDKLAQSLLTNSTALQEMGFGINTSIGFLSSLEKSGVDSSAVMTGLKKALQNATKDGVSMSDALADLQEQMANASTDTEAAQAAMELFGAKAGPAIAAAVEDGRLSFDELTNTVTDWGDSVSTTFEDTQDPMDQFQTTLNELKLLGADLVEAAGPLITDVVGGLTTGVKDLSDAWNGLSPEMQDTIIKIAGVAAVAGPLLVIGGKAIGGISSLVGGIGSLTGSLGSVASAAGTATAPVAAAGGAIQGAAAGAISMIGAAVALFIAAEAFHVLADSAIEVSSAGGPAIATLAGMAIGIGALMGIAMAAQVEWMQDLEKASALAKAQNKLLLVEFTGSDWCRACLIQKKRVLSQLEFEEWVQKHCIAVEVDVPHDVKRVGGHDARDYAPDLALVVDDKILGVLRLDDARHLPHAVVAPLVGVVLKLIVTVLRDLVHVGHDDFRLGEDVAVDALQNHLRLRKGIAVDREIRIVDVAVAERPEGDEPALDVEPVDEYR